MQQLRKLGNNEAKVAETLESGYFGILHSNSDFIEAEIADLVIDEEDVPESYFELQKRIARERGYGEIEFTEGVKDETIVTLQDDQAESLTEWADYLRSEENGHVYPDWFKVYAWESLKKMGDFDKEKGEFKKRTKSTTAPWPELNAEALAYVYDAIDTGVVQGIASDSDQLNKLLGAGNFAKLYAYAITEVGAGGSPELREITKGSWVKYDQIEGKYTPDYTGADGEYTDDAFVDNPTVIALTDSLRGMGTGWCTAGTRTAAHQLSMGDFYVYYTQNEEGEDTIPRIAIRMENGQVGEVRGIGPNQHLETNMTDIVADKLKTLPGGEHYSTKLANVRRLTEMDTRVKSGGELTPEDLYFLRFPSRKGLRIPRVYPGSSEKNNREIDIVGFGQHSGDPRAFELLAGRDAEDDISAVLEYASHDGASVSLGDVLNELPYEFKEKHVVQLATMLQERSWPLGYIGGDIVGGNVEALLSSGINPDYIAKALDSTQLFRNMRMLKEAGSLYDFQREVDGMVGGGSSYSIGIVLNNIQQVTESGVRVDIISLINKATPESIINNAGQLIAAGVDRETVLSKVIIHKGRFGHESANTIKTLLADGFTLGEVIERVEGKLELDSINKLVDEGVSVVDLMPAMDDGAILQLADKIPGFDATAFIAQMTGESITENIDAVIHRAPETKLADFFQGQELQEIQRQIREDAPDILRGLMEGGVSEEGARQFLVANGANPDDLRL